MKENKQKLEDYFIELGYSEYDIANMKKLAPKVFYYSVDIIKQKIEDLKEIGYSKDDIIHISKTFPGIYSRKINTIKKKINNIVNIGFSQMEVLKIIRRFPQILGHDNKEILNKVEKIKKLGYSQKDFIQMANSFPSIFGLKFERIKACITNIKSLGYTEQEAIEITKKFPTIIGYEFEGIKQKIKFYDSINLHFIAIQDPKKLMQSTALSYARYMFYLERGIIINEFNYSRLFVNQSRFKKAYGVSNAWLLAKYDYKEYLKNEKLTDKNAGINVQTAKDNDIKSHDTDNDVNR